jgi:4-amino-4-deoxy-L-arabinose transferase-like glycosyltransferase
MTTHDSLSYASALPAVPQANRFTAAKFRWTMLIVAVAALVQFCIFLEDKPVTNTFEGRVALSAREMLLRHDWLVPRVANVPRLQKPPLAYWLVASLWKLAGSQQQVWLLRLPMALCGAIGALMMMDLGRLTLGRLGGRGVRRRLGQQLLHHRRIPQSDVRPASSPSSRSSACGVGSAPTAHDDTRPGQARGFSRRPKLLLLIFYIALGLGSLAKGHMILVHAALAIIPVSPRLSPPSARRMDHLLGILIALSIALPWPILIYKKLPAHSTSGCAKRAASTAPAARSTCRGFITS